MTGGPGKLDLGAGAGIVPVAIIRKFYPPDSKAFDVLLRHGEQVAEKSLRIARNIDGLSPDISFIEEAAILHDIGMIRTRTPSLGCSGESPYICHGVFGREMLDGLGLPRHGLVCERHVGTGLTAADIAAQGLPLPPRDMRPVSIEEKIIAYADKFFSKKSGQGGEKPFADVVREIERYGRRQVETFLAWAEMFGDR
ncbi:MAG: HD domain-containing protein [Thermodesulfobacteriota bacterium]